LISDLTPQAKPEDPRTRIHSESVTALLKTAKQPEAKAVSQFSRMEEKEVPPSETSRSGDPPQRASETGPPLDLIKELFSSFIATFPCQRNACISSALKAIRLLSKYIPDLKSWMPDLEGLAFIGTELNGRNSQQRYLYLRDLEDLPRSARYERVSSPGGIQSDSKSDLEVDEQIELIRLHEDRGRVWAASKRQPSKTLEKKLQREWRDKHNVRYTSLLVKYPNVSGLNKGSVNDLNSYLTSRRAEPVVPVRRTEVKPQSLPVAQVRKVLLEVLCGPKKGEVHEYFISSSSGWAEHPP
jgi:hypothetical protein